MFNFYKYDYAVKQLNTIEHKALLELYLFTYRSTRKLNSFNLYQEEREVRDYSSYIEFDMSIDAIYYFRMKNIYKNIFNYNEKDLNKVLNIHTIKKGYSHINSSYDEMNFPTFYNLDLDEYLKALFTINQRLFQHQHDIEIFAKILHIYQLNLHYNIHFIRQDVYERIKKYNLSKSGNVDNDIIKEYMRRVFYHHDFKCKLNVKKFYFLIIDNNFTQNFDIEFSFNMSR
ncbi:MAG: hypothetical protein U1E31_03055 [Rickettsiales bacterium]